MAGTTHATLLRPVSVTVTPDVLRALREAHNFSRRHNYPSPECGDWLTARSDDLIAGLIRDIEIAGEADRAEYGS